jgi:GT2 family glycosyltransferase
MNPLTVIIPSRNVENLRACLWALEDKEPTWKVIVVDDGVDWAKFGPAPLGLRVEVIRGEKPFVFARNCNLGIEAARERESVREFRGEVDVTTAASSRAGRYSDVVLLNDDAILKTPGGFTAMQQAAAADPKLALVAATTNVVNNRLQFPLGTGGVRPAGRLPYAATFPSVAFVCVLIPARTLETIGLLDERYTAYGWEDVDYCRRIDEAGLSIAIDDRCFVDHSKLRSTFRGDPRAPGSIDEGRKIYLDKWGKL